MSTFTNYPGSAKRLIGFLILLNIFCLAALWIGRPPGRHLHNDHDHLIHKIKKELQLSDEQLTDLQTMVSRHRDEQDALRDKIKQLRPSLMDALTVSPVDTSLANSIAIKIGEFSAQRELLGVRHFEELSKICNPEQQEILKELMKRMDEKKNRKRGGKK